MTEREDTWEGLKALVADDDPAICEAVGHALLRHGFDVRKAADGHEVVRLLKNTHVDLLVSDIRMPGLDGLEVVDIARRMSPHTSSIIITGAASLETARGAAQRGAYDCLPKPFSNGDLIGAVNAALTRKSEERHHAREQELRELFKLSQEVRDHPDPWQMVRLTATTALFQTQSDVGCLIVPEDGALRQHVFGPEEFGEQTAIIPSDSLVTEAAQKQKPILHTPLGAHPLTDIIDDIRGVGVSILGPVVEALVVPLSAGGQGGGAIAVGRMSADHPYNKGDFQLLSVLATQCGILLSNLDLVERLHRSYVGAVHAMARAVEARDPYTHGHSQRVSSLCRSIGAKLGLASDDMETLTTAADLHDIGKLAVPDSILNKPGSLTSEEWLSIRRHPVVGAEVLAPATFLQHVVPLVLHHHERYDGKGYPDQLADGQMSPLTHIIIAADAWDAMTSDRPYRPSLTTDAALREIESGRGTQFAPDVADTMLELFAHAQAA